MGTYTEVFCDLRTYTKLNGGCATTREENPSGRTVAEAKAKAKEKGWQNIGKGQWGCPACLEFIS